MPIGFGRNIVRYDFSPTIGFTARKYDVLGLDIRSFREPLKRSVQQVLAPSLQKNFDVGGRPSWEPLAEQTLLKRDKDGIAGDAPLVRTGKLRKTMGQLNIWTITQDTAEIQSLPEDVWYGKIHQAGLESGGAATSMKEVGKIAAKDTKGFNGIPQRRFVLFQEEDERGVERVFEDWLGERMRRSGFVVV